MTITAYRAKYQLRGLLIWFKGEIMYNSYSRGGVMALLLKEVVAGSIQNRQPGKKLWRVYIGGELIGFIQTGWSLNKRYKYTATSTMGHEYDSCKNFMQALSKFISPAIDAIERQGMKERAYVGKLGVFNFSNTYFMVEKARYDQMDQVEVYILRMEDSPGSMPRYSEISSFDLRFQTLMGLTTIA